MEPVLGYNVWKWSISLVRCITFYTVCYHYHNSPLLLLHHHSTAVTKLILETTAKHREYVKRSFRVSSLLFPPPDKCWWSSRSFIGTLNKIIIRHEDHSNNKLIHIRWCMIRMQRRNDLWSTTTNIELYVEKKTSSGLKKTFDYLTLKWKLLAPL